MPTFFVVLISIYLAGNIYIFRRGAQALVAQPFGVKVLLAVLFWCGALAFIGSFLARNTKLPGDPSLSPGCVGCYDNCICFI